MKIRFATPLLLALGTGFLLPASAQTAAAPEVEPVTVRAVANFGFDQAALRADERDDLLAEVHDMKGVTWQSVTATGHTDSIGPQAYNEVLSARRAKAVKDYLVGQGLDPAMIDTEAMAATAPVAGNDDPAGRAKNRRTEIEFKGVRPMAAR